MAALKPLNGGKGTDFSGDEYTIETLPAVASEGDTCELAWPGGSGWYQTWYHWENGQWIEDGSTAPWQLSA